jgi:hypothetical protein
VEIVDSGIIQVREGEIDEEEEDEEGEGDSFNTDIEPYRRTLSGGDGITIDNSPLTPIL